MRTRLAIGFALAVSLGGCGRGLLGDSRVWPVDATASPDEAERAPDAAMDAAPDGPAAAAPADASPEVATDIRPDGREVPSLPPGTMWRSCGTLGTQGPNAIAHTADGNRLLAATPQGFFDSIPLAGGEQTSYFVDAHALTRIAVSRDGSRIAAVGDGLLMVWRSDVPDPASRVLGFRNVRAL